MITRANRINWNKGEFEGNPYDYTRLEIEVPIFAGSPNEFGVNKLVCELGNEEVHKQFLSWKDKLPAIVDVEFVPVKKNNSTIHQVVKLDFIESCQIDYSKYENWRSQVKQQKS